MYSRFQIVSALASAIGMDCFKDDFFLSAEPSFVIGISENDHLERIPGSLLCSLSEVAFYFRELNNVL